MNCTLRVQAGPEIKGEVISLSWENREKFAASREKYFGRRRHDRSMAILYDHYYEPLADLFFPYFNIGPNNNKTKINDQTKKKKKCSKKFFVNL